MDLRYRLAVVTDAGAGLGREIATALSRRGAAVLAVDRDLAAAEETASLVREARVRAWALQGDITEEADVGLLAARTRDLGGMDLLVSHLPTHDYGALTRLTQVFLDGLAHRQGRRDGTPAVVHVAATTDLVGFVAGLEDLESTGGARLMAVVPSATTGPSIARTTRAVVQLLSHGVAGQVVDLSDASPAGDDG